ncbi:obscurin-like protein [Pitangus sulphuratus]|nr:obscurin-like protein [Pitangus sulphuratus]
MTPPQSRMETSVQASLQRADQEIKTALRRLMDSASMLVTLPLGVRGEGGLGLPGSAPPDHSEAAAVPSVLVHEASTQTQAPGGHDKAQRQVSAEEPSVPKPSPAPSQEDTAAGGGSARERTIPIDRTSPEAGAGGWYRREGDVVWDVHSEVYIETTERTRVYKTEEKTPASPPYMQVTIEDVQVNSGERAKFQAVIEGTPPPTVLWFKGTSLLADSDRVHQGREGTTYFLEVDDASLEDGGVYTCVAKNAGGEVLCKAELVVREAKKDQEGKKAATRRKLHAHYEVKQEIGRGCFSFVKRVVHKGNRVSCAAKFIPLRSKTRSRAHQERDILASLSHDRITRLLDEFETRKTLILVLELAVGVITYLRKTLLNIQSGEISWTIPDVVHLSEDAKDFMKGILQQNPKARPSALDCLSHKWFMRSLMCYKSILVMRSIPEILERTHDNSSLAISRHLIEESTSSSTSGSSSDNENSNFPTKRHFGSTPELHLPVFDAPSYQEPPKRSSEQKHSKTPVPPVKPMRRKYASMKAEVGDKSPTESKELVASVFQEKEEGLHPSAGDERADPSSVRASRASTSHPGQKDKPADRERIEKARDGTEQPSAFVPRQSVIKSTFYSQATELPARLPSSTGREFRRHLDRARRTFRKAGYSKVPLSGLREPLLEQFELEEEEEEGDDRREGLLGSLTKSASFDTARKPPHPAIAGASRSRSLDDYRLRASRSLREQDILEEDCDVLSQESCPEGSDHCDISAGPGKGCSADTSKQEDVRRASKDCSGEKPPPSTHCEGDGCPAAFMQQAEGLAVSPHRSQNRKPLLKKSKATEIAEDVEDLEGKSPILTAQCSDVTASAAQKHESMEGKSSSDTAFREGKESIATLTQSEATSESPPTSKGGVCLLQESAHSTDIHPDKKGGTLLIKRTAPVPPWKDKRQKHSDEKTSAHSVAESEPMEYESSAVPAEQTETHSHPVSKGRGQEIPGKSVSLGKRPGALTAGEGAAQKVKTRKEVRSAALEDEGLGVAGVTPPSAHAGESQAHRKAPVRGFTAAATLKGEHLAVPKVPPPQSVPTADGARAEREGPAHSQEGFAALRGESSAVPEAVPSLAHKGAKPQKTPEGHAVPEGRHTAGTVSSQSTVLPSVCEREKQEPPPLHSEVRAAVTASGSPAAAQALAAPFPKAGHGVLEQHRAAHPGVGISDGLGGALTAAQPEVAPAPVCEVEYEEHPKVPGEGGGVALERGSSEAGRAVPPSLRRDRGRERSHHRSSFYSDEESAVLEGLVDEMVSLSEEMNVWAESVSGEKESRRHISPPTEVLYKGPGTQAPTDTSFPSVKQSGRGEVSEQDDLEEPYLAVREESEVLEGQGAQTVPHECEHLEDLAFESPTSSRASVSSAESLDTGKRPSRVPVVKDTGKHPEVSLVKIKDLSDEAPSTGSGPQKFDISEVEPAYLNFSDLYDIVYFPFEFLSYKKPSPKPVRRRFIPLGERARSPPAGHLHKDKRLCIREQAEDKNRKNHLEISEDSKAAHLVAMGKGGESHKEMYSSQKDSSGKQKSSFHTRPGLFKPYARSHSVELSVEQSLKKKVKASVAHISRILKGKTSPEPEAEEAPSFTEELMDQAAAVGQCVTLSCRTAAHPSLHVSWFRDGIPVQGSSRILISSTLKHFQLLTILSVNAEDFGIYTCVATNSLGSASTSCVIRKAEVPPSPPPPDIVEVYKDGVQVVWKPVETNTPVHYTIQCKSEDGEWTTLASDLADCCYYAKNLPKGFIYHFRIACTSKAGMGPYSDPSASVKITGKDPAELRAATQDVPSSPATEEESEIITPSEPFPTYQTYAFQTEIKRGRFSIVRQCREKVSGKTLAAKIIPYWQEDKQTVLLEYQVLRKLHHTNIAQLKGAYVSPRHLVLIQEMCVGPELLHCLALRTSYSEVEVRDYLWQILSATEYLHAHNILHLDLRSENMIITEPNLLKLVDFGNAQFYAQDKFITNDKCTDYVETMAPELLTEQGALPQTDIWSIGITAFIMLSANYPVSSDVPCEFLRTTRKGKVKLTRCYAGLSGGAVSFLQSTLCANPWGRLSASECLQSPWLQETGLDSRQQALVTFPTTKLRNFLMEREKKRGLLCSKYGLMVAQ